MTNHLQDTQTLRAVTIPDATFDNRQVDRIVHLMRICMEQCAKDVQTFEQTATKAAAEDRHGVAVSFRGIAREFERYIQEGEFITNRLDALNGDAMLAFVDLDGDSSQLIEILTDLFNEEALDQ